MSSGPFDPLAPSEKPDFEAMSQAERLQVFKNTLVVRATTTATADQALYIAVRKEIIGDQALKILAPKFVVSCRTLEEFWVFIKAKFEHYKERREFLSDELEPLLAFAEQKDAHPRNASAELALRKFNEPEVREIWQRMLIRSVNEPEGAITAARALVETVCKHVLDKLGQTYPHNAELPKLYALTASALNLAPSQHTEDSFRRILAGCQQIVDGIANIRNKLSDSHGKGLKPVKPAPRHAELVVNVAGSMSAFLIATWEKRTSGATT